MQNQLHRKLFKSSIKRKDKQLAGEKLTLKTLNICFSEQVTDTPHSERCATGQAARPRVHPPLSFS